MDQTLETRYAVSDKPWINQNVTFPQFLYYSIKSPAKDKS